MAFWRNAPRNLWRNHARRLLPHVGPPLGLAIVQALVGLLVLVPVLRRIELGTHGDGLAQLLHLIDSASLAVLPQLVVGIGLEIMAIGLLLRARVAWNLSLLLLAAAVVLSRVGLDRSDALLSIGSLLIYAVLGTLYLGHDFSPPIEDLSTAFYFSIVSMSTVGYGDITPHTAAARLFTASIIVFGITVFATSISAVVGPMIGGSLKRIVKGGISNVTRKDHFVIVGASPIAHSVYAGLRKRGYAVAVLVPANVGHSYPEEADLIAGDASDAATLKAAGAATARAVLALRADDAENAFTVLAIRDLAPQVRTVALVNDPRNLHRLRLLKPDMVFSPQQLAGELLARTLNEETIDNALVSQLLFGTGKEEAA